MQSTRRNFFVANFPGTGVGTTGESTASFAAGLVTRRRLSVARRAPAVVVVAADSRRSPAGHNSPRGETGKFFSASVASGTSSCLGTQGVALG